MASLAVVAQTDYEKKGDGYLKYRNFERAFREYARAYSKSKESSTLLEKMIECLLNDQNPRELAIPYLEAYRVLNPNHVESLYQMAQALYHGHRFDEASDFLSQYRAAGGSADKTSGLEQTITVAKAMAARPLAVELVNLGKEVNSARADVNPMIAPDHQTLFYSSDERFNSYAGIYYYNVKMSENSGTGWGTGKTFGANINTIYDEWCVGYGAARGELYFHHNRNKEEVLAVAPYLGKGKLGMGVELGYPFDLKGPEMGATLSVTGDTIVFSGANMEKKMDLFFSIRMPDQSWGEPRLLPGKVNSASDDNYPTFSPCGTKLFFSSNRPGTMGGYDLYETTYNPQTREWMEPEQLPYPLNDTYDNLTICMSSNPRYAYISAILPGGFGNKDIYRVVFPDAQRPVGIFRCQLVVKESRGSRSPAVKPQIKVYNQQKQKVAEASMLLTNGVFMLALEPGTYQVAISSPEIADYRADFVVPENAYSTQANAVTFEVMAK